MAQSNRDMDEQEAMIAAEETGTDPAVIAAAGSVVLSWYYFFGKNDAAKGLFVGLWPPTILAFASYFQQSEMSDNLENATKGQRGGVRESVQKMVGNQ